MKKITLLGFLFLFTGFCATSQTQMTDEELLTKTQQYTFKYFWDYADENSGMAHERLPLSGTPGNTVTSGGSGFGVMAILVGVERGFITREQGRQRIEKMSNQRLGLPVAARDRSPHHNVILPAQPAQQRLKGREQ